MSDLRTGLGAPNAAALEHAGAPQEPQVLTTSSPAAPIEGEPPAPVLETALPSPGPAAPASPAPAPAAIAAPKPAPSPAASPAISDTGPAPAATKGPALLDKLAAARADGYSWDDIGAALAPKYQGALQDGYTPQEINGALGVKPNPDFDAALRAHMDPKTWAATPGNDPASWVVKTRQTYARGIASGAIMSAEEFADRALSAIYDLGSDVAGDAWRGFVEGAQPGSPLGLSPEHEAFLERSGLFNAPGEKNVLKSLNEAIVGGGIVALDAANRVWNGAAGAAGAVGAGIGGRQVGEDVRNVVTFAPLVGPSLGALRAAGRLGLGVLGAASGADVATAATEAASKASRVFAGGLVAGKDLIDGAVALGKSVKPELVPGGAATTALNIANHAAETGEGVPATLDRAEHDPNFRNGLLAPQHAPAASDASVTPTPDGDFVIPRPAGKLAATVAQTPADVTPEQLAIFRTLEGSPDIDGTPQVSKAGAVGVYQVLPSTAEHYGIAGSRLITDEGNEAAARAVLSDLSKRYNGDLEAMAVAYNAGPSAADRWIAAGRDRAMLPEQTQKYLAHLDRIETGNLEYTMAHRPGEVGAIGNLGAAPPLTVDEQALLGHIETPPGTFTLARETVDDLADDAYRGFLHGDHPLIKIQDVVAAGRPIADAENPAFLRRMAETDTTAQYAIERDMTDLAGNVTGPGFKTIMGEVAGKVPQFTAYAIAKWAVEKAAQAKETGVEADAAKRVVEAGAAEFEATFQKLVNFQNGSLAWLRDAGFHDAAAYEAMVAGNKARIPGYRADDEAKLHAPGRVVRDPVRRFVGSTTKLADNPLKAILSDTLARARLARENIANRAIADMAKEIGVGEKVKAAARKFDLTPAELAKIGGADAAEQGAVWRAVGVPLRQGEVPIFRDGKMEKWTFSDPQVAEVLRGYDKQSLNTIQHILAYTARVQRTGIVAAPTFPVRLLAYDVPWQFITKPGFRNTIADTYRGLRALFQNGAEYDAYLRQGAAERVFNSLSGDAYVKDVVRGYDDPSIGRAVWNSTGGNALKGLQAWATFITQSQRVGRYLRGVEAGESDLRAGVAATEAAFHRSGFGGPMSKNVNRISPFFAAYLNGMEQTIRGQFGLGKTVLGDDRSALNFSAKALGLVTLPMLANYALSRNAEWYKAAPDWQKNNGLLFHVGPDNGDGTTFYIPYPPLLGLIYGGLPRMLIDGFIAGNPHAAAHLVSSIGASLLPPTSAFIGGTVLPVIEHLANHSFFRDQPLVSDDTRRSKLGPEQGSPWSSGAARALSRFTGFAPPVIDNYIQGWGGTLGTAAVRTADMLFGTGPRGEASGFNPPSVKVSDLPLLSSFTSRYPSASAQPIKDFSERFEHAEQVHGSMEAALKAGDLARFQQLASDNPFEARLFAFKLSTSAKMIIGDRDPAELAPYKAALPTDPPTPPMQQIVATQKQLGLLRDYAEAIGAAGKGQAITEYNVATLQPLPGKHVLSGTDKRQLLDSVYMQMQRVAELGGKAMDAAGMK